MKNVIIEIINLSNSDKYKFIPFDQNIVTKDHKNREQQTISIDLAEVFIRKIADLSKYRRISKKITNVKNKGKGVVPSTFTPLKKHDDSSIQIQKVQTFTSLL
jgi:hypothetical protein